jgi:two-component system CheB/CheR fusion protein
LKPELQQFVLDLFAYSLQQSHGYLFLGKAETARPTKGTFDLVNKKWKIYRCLSGPLAFPATQSTMTTHGMNPLGLAPRRRHIVPPTVPIPIDMTQAETEVFYLRRVNETILRYTNVAVVIIDSMYRIVTINTAARRMLGVRDISYDQDFLHTVRGLPYHEVRRAIDIAFREHTTITIPELELDLAAEGSGRYVNLTIMSMQVEPVAPELAVITGLDITEQLQIKRRLEAVQREQADLVSELSGANKRFSAMNKELQDANEELQAGNEELMLTQEELQATNEEFEATNEELQATNEELETNNEELQATNEELQTTNDELSARTAELQEVMRHSRIAQLQLTQLLERFPHYVMILDADSLTVQTINSAYRRLLGNRDVTGLIISEVFTSSEVQQLVKILRAAAREGQSLNTPPIRAGLSDEQRDLRLIHTVVPIIDQDSQHVSRLFIYSEEPT